MNEFSFAELAVGQKASFSREVTDDMLADFARVSGDTNPLHTDECFARAQGYPGRVAYGMLTASLYSALAGMYLPGKYCLLQSVHADFLAPVFVGDTLTVNGEIKEKHDAVRQIVLKAVIRNQAGTKVSRANIEAGALK